MTDRELVVTDSMTSGAPCWLHEDFVGMTIVAAVEIPDSDRCEVLLVGSDGRSVLLSCDPGYDGDSRTPNAWNLVLYDSTHTEAGRAAQAWLQAHPNTETT